MANTGSSQTIRCGDPSPKKVSKMDENASPLLGQGETSVPLKAYDIISLRNFIETYYCNFNINIVISYKNPYEAQ